MIQLHSDLFDDTILTLNCSDYRVLFLLLKLHDTQDEQYIDISQCQIAKQLSMMQCNVHKALHKLERLGIILEISRRRIVLNNLISCKRFS